MKAINKYLKWLDQNILEIVAGFLIVFVPLYPKWPLFDALPGYIVRVRLDDFIILASLLLVLIQAVRGKIRLKKNPLFLPILIYLIIGFLSSLSALFITRTVPLEALHAGKLFLHWARRVEYMSLGLFFFFAIRSKQSLKRILLIFVTTVTLIGLYGFGQKYLSWPVYSTMNREFAKGWRLVLTEHARVSSTFAGHYDLAAYNVIALIVITSLTILVSKKTKPILAIIFLVTFAILLLTASRTSFIAYLGGISLLVILLSKSIGVKKAFKYWLVIMLVSGIGIRTFGTLYSRFAHILMLDRVELFLAQTANKFKPETQNDFEISKDLSLVLTPTDQPPTTPPPDSSELPPDVFEAIPLTFPEASLSAIPSTSGTGTEGQARTYSDAAFQYGLSSAIRFDALWPKAIAGFKKNPLLGSGYSTLLKDQVTDFTDAESSDNDYLRALGETGLLGFLSFFGIFAFMLYRAYIALLATKDKPYTAFLAAFIASIAGLLVNALYIDVFEASKVAYTAWAFMGIAASVIALTKSSKQNS